MPKKVKTAMPAKTNYVCADPGIKGGRSMKTSGLHGAKKMPQNDEYQHAQSARMNSELKGAGKP